MNYTWIDSFIYSFIPFIVILCVNAALVNKVIRAKRNIAKRTKKSHLNTENKEVQDDKKTLNSSQNLEENNLLPKISPSEKTRNTSSVNPSQIDRLKYMTFTVLGVTFLFIIFTMPINIYLPIMQARAKLKDEKKVCNDDVLFHILNNMVNCNHAVNFFIYLFTNTKFKNEIKDILKEIANFLVSINFLKSNNSSNINNDVNSRVSTFTFTKNTTLTTLANGQNKNET